MINKLLKQPFFHLFALNENDEKTRFLRFYVSKSLNSIRLAMILGFVLYGLFGIIDLYVANTNILILWVIRFVVVMPMVVVVFILTYASYFIRYSQLILFILAAIFSLGVIAIIFNCEAGGRFYYPGLILCMFGIHTTLRLKLELALIVSGIIIGTYTLCMLLMNPPNNLILLISNDLS